MATPEIQVMARKVSPAASVLDIRGDVTGFAEAAIMDAYNEAISSGTRAVILNFNDLEYMNSSGIGLLVTLLIRAQRHERRLLAYGLSDHYRQIFELTRLNEAIATYPGEAEALEGVSEYV